jgi:phosphoribosylamine-glycine ligase
MSIPSLRVLLVGNGGREHALAWKLVQSPHVDHIYVVPGNGGTAGFVPSWAANVPITCVHTQTKPRSFPQKVTNVSNVKADDFAALVKFARDNSINFLVPGPEAPLVAGIVDYFAQHLPDVKSFGPNEAAARMEGSKAFSKDFMKDHNIPHCRIWEL